MNANSQLRPNRRQVHATIVSAGAVGLGGAMIARPAHAKQITIRFNHTDGNGGEAYHFSEKLKSLLAERTSGRMVVQNFHSGQLGAEKDMYDSMQIGSIEMGRSGSLIISVAAPQYGALELPYVFRSQQHLRNVLAGPIGQAMHQEFLTLKGVRVLGIVNRGARQLTTKNRAVKTDATGSPRRLVAVALVALVVGVWNGVLPTPGLPTNEGLTAITAKAPQVRHHGHSGND